jgi:hypothetical protein
MTEIDVQIIDLLNRGWSYSQIQDELQVSSKTIAAAKKAHFPIMESTTDVLSSDAPKQNLTQQQMFNDTNLKIKSTTLFNQKTKKMNTENNDYDDDNISSKLELEKFRLKLAHVLEMEKLQVAREDKEREHNLRELEIEKEKRKSEEEKRSLLFRIKKVIDTCEDAEFSYEDAENLLEEARKVLSESEKYCFINQITFQGSASHSILGKVISTLTDFLDGMDEDDTDDLEFDSAFRRQVSRVTFQTF